MKRQTMNTDELLDHAEILDDLKATGYISNELLSQRGLDWLNDELSAIEAELDTRMPEGEFVTMLGENDEPVGFEPYIGEGSYELAR